LEPRRFIIANAQEPIGSDPFGLGVDFLVELFASTELLAYSPISKSDGTAFLAGAIPNNPAIAGATDYAQGLCVEGPTSHCSPSPLHLVSTRGLSMTIAAK
jgi:hypothetical protein